MKLKKLLEIQSKFYIKAPSIILFFIGGYYCLYMFLDFSKDTTSITNVAFGISSVLAGLSLGVSSSLESDDVDKDMFRFSGERFFHSSLILITASILKYSSISIREISFIKSKWYLKLILTTPIDFLVPFLFFWALLTAHTGFIFANNTLWKRMARKKGWGNFT